MNILYDGKVVGKIIDSKIVDVVDEDLRGIAGQIKLTGGVTLMVPSYKSSDEKIVDGAEFVAVESDDFPTALLFYLFERGFDVANHVVTLKRAPVRLSGGAYVT